ncbi:Glycosyl transferase, family 2 [Olavius algarvensis associated proteobacterium Delta 3]|nr:Glycosyl transferase, family 2 [Olavius algarvensis associated proteobacterium Delta 3]
MPAVISVIIPVFQEASVIHRTLTSVFALRGTDCCEILVVDGEPSGGTIRAIAHDTVRKIRSAKGCAVQMNEGARRAIGDILLFLHADTTLPVNAVECILEVADVAEVVGGAFTLGIDSRRKVFRIIEAATNLRNRLLRVPYGDQAIFLRRTFFEELGGYSDLPLMEDVELMQRIRRTGARIRILKDRVQTSPRRWDAEGIVLGTLRNWLIRSLFAAGVSPRHLVKLYPF